MSNLGETRIPSPLALESFKNSKLLILMDQSDPVKRSVLVSPALSITPALVNKMLTLSGGILFVAISRARAESLMLAPMSRPATDPSCVENPASPFPGLCQSVEAREGVTTGISAADRARTVSLLATDETVPRDLVKPGHIFPVMVQDGGLMARHALAEGAYDAVILAQDGGAAAFLDLLDPKGDFLKPEECKELALEQDIPLLTLEELTWLRLQREQMVERIAEARLPTRVAGEFTSIAYRSRLLGTEHLALIKGKIEPDQPVLTRVQAESLFGDIFGGLQEGRKQLHAAMRCLEKHGSGVLVYLRSTICADRGPRAASTINSNNNPTQRMMREYGLGAQILRDLGVRKIELLSGSQVSFAGLRAFDMEVVAQRPLEE